MRILIVPSWYPTSNKPVNGIFIREQVYALAKEHEVMVLYLDVLPRGSKTKTTSTLERDRGYVEQTIQVRNLPLLWQFAYLMQMARSLRALRRTFRPDIVHCHIAVPAGWAVGMLRRFLARPIVLTENTSRFDDWLRRPGLKWMARTAFSAADMAVAVGEGQRQRIESTFHRYKNLIVIPNIVDAGKFFPTTQAATTVGFRLLFVGLLDTDQKGLHILLEALSILSKPGRLTAGLHTDIVGDGTLRPDYERQVRESGIDGTVTFHGLQSPDKIAQMLSEAHALVLPSLHEATPLVVIEALFSGRPVISTRCGGPEYMIDDTNGLIVEPGQAEPLAEAIIDVLTHLDRYDPQQLAAAAKERYGYEAVTSALTEVYKRLMASRSERPK
jgi:glycosyltransferase involved in cell wall biosynthesis